MGNGSGGGYTGGVGQYRSERCYAGAGQSVVIQEGQVRALLCRGRSERCYAGAGQSVVMKCLISDGSVLYPMEVI